MMLSGVSYKGIPTNLPFYGIQSYTYGLSDFWRMWFQDQELVERTMESTSFQLSIIYEKFLQICTNSDLFNIKEATHHSIKLILIDEDELNSDGFSIAYSLKEKVLSAKYAFDRPLLPKKSYELDVHFGFSDDGSKIEFYKPLAEMDFPARKILKNGVEVVQYSVWLSDAEIDEQSLYRYFGKFVRISPQTSTETYKQYIQGLYFLYLNGPTVSLLSRGIHLALGIPVAQDSEEVLLVRQDQESANYVVVTENNSYTVPFGISPNVVQGDLLEVGEELATVAKIVDHTVQDNWWVDLPLPPYLFPGTTLSPVAEEASFEDYAMRKYLKYHTFLVELNISGLLTSAIAQEIMSLILDAKPKYTLPINVWSLDYTYTGPPDRNKDREWERSGTNWIHGNGDLSGYTGDTVSVAYPFYTTISSSSKVKLLDGQLIPLYNLEWKSLKALLLDLGVSIPVSYPEYPKRNFLVSGVNLVAKYNEVVLGNLPNVVSGIGYNSVKLGRWKGEVNRVFVPTSAQVTNSETLAITNVVGKLYSLFLYRAGGNTLFNPVYFPAPLPFS